MLLAHLVAGRAAAPLKRQQLVINSLVEDGEPWLGLLVIAVVVPQAIDQAVNEDFRAVYETRKRSSSSSSRPSWPCG